VKHPSPCHGQPVLDARGRLLGHVVAQVVAPVETLLISPGGDVPGVRLDPAQWARAQYDAQRQAWIVLPPEESA
jgi:hypothetical protein